MKIKDDILSYREMCDAENMQTLQRGMNYRLNPKYSVVLMSQRSGAPYNDVVHEDGVTIEYEGHDVTRNSGSHPKTQDQPSKLPSGKLTQNGLFMKAIEDFKKGKNPELVKIYEKVFPGVWSMKGFFDLIDVKVAHDGIRNVYKFILKVSARQDSGVSEPVSQRLEHTRLIPSDVKKEVWKRDMGKCVSCGSSTNLHFDHDLPFSKGGTSLSAKNVRLLCMKHNLQKSDKIE